MVSIVVGSLNPVKLEAVRIGYATLFPLYEISVQGFAAESLVSAQPMSDWETWKGARNRAVNAYKAYPDADFWIGVEEGIEILRQQMLDFVWVYVISKNGIASGSRGPSFTLPKVLVDPVYEGVEVGVATDKVFGLTASKHGGGAIGFLSDNIYTRTAFIVPAVICAFLPFKRSDLYISEG